MSKLDLGKAPPDLDGETSAGGKETAEAIAFYAKRGNRSKSFERFQAYKKKDVIDALNKLFSFKCAYCESTYEATQPVDVEHYRPKAGVDVDGKLQRPGYYWLAATWGNLLPSCIDCNRARRHDFPDVDPEIRGKANRFPIGNPAQRAAQPGEEAKEKRLLLHPAFDDPDEHLEFIEEGVVRPAVRGGKESQMGRVSIEIYGLDRPGLVHARRDRLIRIMGLVKNARTALERLAQPGRDAARKRELEEDLRDLRQELESYQTPDQVYCTMSRQVVARSMRDIG
jgi:uncharacterized protein (TIGR02646 family)